MYFEKNPQDQSLTVMLDEELDATNSPELKKMLEEEIPGIKELIFDLSRLEYVSSAGLRVFLHMQKYMKSAGKMCIRNVGKDVMAIFRVTGFIKLLNIEK